MESINKSLLFKIAILVAILAFVSCLNDKSHQVYKKKVNRGIILKCQGNPISCYGKRAFGEDSEQQQTASASSEESENSPADALLQEYKYERQLEILIRNCKLGIEKACNTMLEIMLMNSNY